MNNCVFLPKDIKNIIIEYILPPTKWTDKKKKEIAKIFKMPTRFDYIYISPSYGKLNTTSEIFYNVLSSELYMISENIKKIKMLEINILNTSTTCTYFQNIVSHYTYSIYIHGHIHDKNLLKYL
jgi:hypothetical protein